MLVVLLLTATAFADQALTWNRIGRGGLDGPYSPIQYGPGASCLFNGKLYYGTEGGWSFGGQIWCYDGHDWVIVHKPKAGKPRITSVTALAVLGDYLYAGMNLTDNSCQVWRTKGTGKPPYQWTKVSGPANIENDDAEEVPSMTVIKSLLYVAARSSNYGCQVWAYNGSAWSQVVGQGPSGSPTGPGFGTKDNYNAPSMVSSAAGDLYVGTSNSKGAEVWRKNKSGWAKLNNPGFGTSKNYIVNVLIFFKNSLYAGTRNWDQGCQIWKYLGPSPSNWKAVVKGGLGDPKNETVASAAVFGTPGYLFFITENRESGCQVLRTNGTKWEKANKSGFGEGHANPWGTNLIVFNGELYSGVDSWFGARIYATSGGSKLPFAWTLVNENGFSTNDNEDAPSAAIFGGRLHIGTFNGLGCEVWRYEGNGWIQVASSGFGDLNNSEAMSMASAGGFLYVGTYNGETGAEIWRYDGSKWTQANKNGFGDASTENAQAMIVYQGKLYVGTESYKTKGKVWRCDGPGASQWTQVNTNGFGVSHTIGVNTFVVFNDKLYAGTYDSNDPCRVWRYDGPGPTGWTAVSLEGFGNKDNHEVNQLAVYKGALYALVWNAAMTGCEAWRYSGSGTIWSKVNVSGFGKQNNSSAYSMLAFSNKLYVGTVNGTNGGEIWAYDGSVWSQANKSGFGTNNNRSISVLISDGGNLYTGTNNSATGCEVWTTGAGSSSPLIWRASPFSAPRKPRRR